MSVGLRHLRYFIAVAAKLHFARVVERLHIEQSPLSRAIKDLEYDLGAQLFEQLAPPTSLGRAGIPSRGTTCVLNLGISEGGGYGV